MSFSVLMSVCSISRGFCLFGSYGGFWDNKSIKIFSHGLGSRGLFGLCGVFQHSMPFSVLLSVCTISRGGGLFGPCGRVCNNENFRMFLTDRGVVVCLVYVVLSSTACHSLCS